MENLEKLVLELCKLPNETQYVEFKHDNYDPKMIGKDISALANSAALQGRSCAYMLWGIDDKDHSLLGTKRDLQSLKKGNQELESWLRNLLSKNANFKFNSVLVDDKIIGVLVIDKAEYSPVTFEKTEYIRIGSYTKRLNEYPAVQVQLWDKIRNEKFENQYALIDLTEENAVRKLDCSVYFDRKNIPIPSDMNGIAHYMIEEGVIIKQDNELFAITNLGALAFAKDVHDFSKVYRKALRIVKYDGRNKLTLLKEETRTKGYAADFEDIIKFIEALLPSREEIVDGIRKSYTAFPNIAIREILANALIHQDFSISGAGPLVEIFDNRIEVTNPGVPLVDVKRIIDNPPRSRNEKLANLLRCLRICEELGTGWDKIIIACEVCNLPAPIIDIYEESTKVTLFSRRNFSDLTIEDKLWACYLHCCIKYVQGDQLSNKSLRIRFGLPDSSTASISRLISLAVSKEFIKPADPTTAPRYMKYIPFWA